MLHQRQDFGDLLVTAGERLGMNPALIEKDYWVTEALRVVATTHADGVVFKGGTSLSKAWGLIKRFSEDIDLLIRQDESTGGTGMSRDRYMRAIEAAVAEVDGLEPVAEGARSERGVSRTSVFTYEPRTALLRGLRPTIILEMGIRGGAHPTEVRPLRSLMNIAIESGEFLDDTLESFEMTVLHPHRTIVEKLFAVHSAAELWYEGRSTAVQRQGRHFYDVHFLLGDPDDAAYVGGPEYLALLPEIDEFGRGTSRATIGRRRVCASQAARRSTRATSSEPRSRRTTNEAASSSPMTNPASTRSTRGSPSSVTGCSSRLIDMSDTQDGANVEGVEDLDQPWSR